MPRLSVSIFTHVFLIGAQDDVAAAACCVNVDVMFAELALNVGLDWCVQMFEYRKWNLLLPLHFHLFIKGKGGSYVGKSNIQGCLYANKG